MEINGTSRAELFALIKIVSKEFKDNIVFAYDPIALNKKELRWRFLLKVKDSKGCGAKIGRNGRHIAYPCFHVWTRFMDLAFTRDTLACVSMRTKFARFKNADDYWEKRSKIAVANIGSHFEPLPFEDACDCRFGSLRVIQ